MTARRQDTEPAKRPQSDASRAASIVNKLTCIDEEEQAELAQSPAAIRSKYECRRQGVMASASDDVRKLVDRMREP